MRADDGQLHGRLTLHVEVGSRSARLVATFATGRTGSADRLAVVVVAGDDVDCPRPF
jgi:hypothetical protein